MGLMETILALMTPIDAIALAIFLLAMFGYKVMTSGDRFISRVSLVGAVQRQRCHWMLNMSRRENRNIDVILLSSLGQGTAFFASTTAIAIGGLATLLGSGERAQLILERLPMVARSSAVLWELKLLIIMGLFVFAFFKFAWSYRLAQYASIMIGATPILASDDSNGDECDAHGVRTAGIAGLSAEHANGGLRSFYYAFAVLAWFFHPLAFIVATVWVVLILIRRDYFSRSRKLIAGLDVPKKTLAPTG